MTVLEYDGHLDEGQSDDHSFTAQQELVYDIEEVCRSDLYDTRVALRRCRYVSR
jgi:hypothetical protein